MGSKHLLEAFFLPSMSDVTLASLTSLELGQQAVAGDRLPCALTLGSASMCSVNIIAALLLAPAACTQRIVAG